MEPRDQTDHIAILALMMVGVLTRRLREAGHLDEETRSHLHQLVQSVRTHAATAGIQDLKSLFDNIDKSLR